MPELEILTPDNLSDALFMISSGQTGTVIIAGGTDIITGLRQNSKRFAGASRLIDINNVRELRRIEIKRDKISIGAAVTFSELLENEIVRNRFPVLWKAASGIGSAQIRNRATIAGNFVNNAPCADSVPALLVYNATVEIDSLASKKEITIAEFLNGPYKTRLKNDEIVTCVNIKYPGENLNGEFYKLGRRRGVAISRISLAVLLSATEDKIQEIRIASGAVTPSGMRFPELEKFASGKKINTGLNKELAVKLGEKVIDVTGLRWSGEYKLPVLQQVFYQMLRRMTGTVD